MRSTDDQEDRRGKNNGDDNAKTLDTDHKEVVVVIRMRLIHLKATPHISDNVTMFSVNFTRKVDNEESFA